MATETATINNYIQNGFVLTTHAYNKWTKKNTESRLKEVEDRKNHRKVEKYGRCRETGLALCVNLCHDLVVIDIDIKKHLTAENKAKIRCAIMREMRKLNVLTVISGNGGLHLYTLYSPNLKQNLKSRKVEIYKDDNVKIDVFISDNSNDVNSLVVLPGSEIADLDSAGRPRNIRNYRYAEGSDGSMLIDKSCYDVCVTLVKKGIVKDEFITKLFNVKKTKPVKIGVGESLNDDILGEILKKSTTPTLTDETPTNETQTDETTNEQQPKETPTNETTTNEAEQYNSFLADPTDEDLPETLDKIIIKGFDKSTMNDEIHGDSGSHKSKDEMTLMVLFQALNSIKDPALREFGYNFIKKNANITTQAINKWDNIKTRNEGKATNMRVLLNYVKLHNETYYNEKIKPLCEREIVDEGLTFNKFSFYDIQRKIYNNVYQTDCDLVEDLIKVMRCCDVGIPTWFEKTSDEKIEQLNKSIVNSKLRDEKFQGRKLIDIVQEHKKEFITRGIKFYTNEEGYLNLFHGYKYKPNDNEEGMRYVEMWNSFVREVIASNRPELYEYIQQWISYIINVIDGKTGTALILRGLQGAGKGTFAHVLIELFSGYVLKNLTDVSQATGKFNAIIEGKKLGMFNELKNAGDDRSANFDALKTVITEREITYEQKFVPSRQGENVINLILMTNNAYPVKIEVGDRRYVLIDVNGKHKGDMNYWDELYDAFDNHKDVFYPALMHFYVQNYYSDFKLQHIPYIQEREDFIDATKSDVQIMIEEHYNEFIAGVTSDNVRTWNMNQLSDKSLFAQINLYCNQERLNVKRQKQRKYTLKPEYVELFKTTETTKTEEAPEEATTNV